MDRLLAKGFHAHLAFVLPNPDLAEQVRALLGKHGLRAQVICSRDESLSDIAWNLRNSGTDVVVSRGGLAVTLRSMLSDIPVVEIRVGAFDVLQAMSRARAVSDSIAVVGFANIIGQASDIARTLGFVRVEALERKDLDDSPQYVERLKSRIQCGEIGVLVGDARIVALAEEHGIPSVLIQSGPRSILLAYEEALRIAVALAEKELTSKQLAAVLDNVQAGILCVSNDLAISVCNRQAMRLIAPRAKIAVGDDGRRCLPAQLVAQLKAATTPEMGVVLSLGGRKVVVNTIPLCVRGEQVGIIATLQDVEQIEQTSDAIRREVAAKGYVARHRFEDIVGKSPSLTEALACARSYGASDAPTIIYGETGVGKELFAQGMHNASSRRDNPFVAVNCAALPESILESELFGYVHGAFTGARQGGKLGLFELAGSGTIFLDEIGDISPAIQARLLRVLQEKQLMRLGADRVTRIDCRIITATNRDLREEVRRGRFREDLYYRLNVLRLTVPPLRQRKGDVKALCRHFLEHYRNQYHKPIWEIEPEVLAAFERHTWPGNVRELQHTVERLVVLTNGNQLSLAGARLELAEPAAPAASPAEDLSDEAVLEALARFKWNKQQAARHLGIHRTTLWRRIKEIEAREGGQA